MPKRPSASRPKNSPPHPSGVDRKRTDGSARRKRIFALGGLLGVMACLLLVGVSSNSIRGSGMRQEDDGLQRTNAIPVTARFVPEYERQMKRVVIAIANGSVGLEYQQEILPHLPSYTEILMLAPEDHLDEIRDSLRNRPYATRVELVSYDPQARNGASLYLVLPDEDQLVEAQTGNYRFVGQYGTFWAQDLFEAATTPQGKAILVTPCVHKCFYGSKDRNDRKVTADNTYLGSLDSETIQVHRSALAFKGGNVLIDEFQGQRIAFCGSDSIRASRTVWYAFHGKRPSVREIAEEYREQLNVDRVAVIGGKAPQPAVMYHLDQAMLLLGDGIVAVPRIVGPPLLRDPQASNVRHVKQFLATLRATLCELGYTVVDIDTTASNVLKYQHYVNSVPYTDRETGQRTLLMPAFSNQPFEQDRLLIEKNVKTLESLGYAVVQVPTSASELYGGIHCLINVLD